MLVTGPHNALGTREQHGSTISASPTKTVQLMLFFSNDDSLTFCLSDDLSDSCLSFQNPETTRDSKKFAQESTKQQLQRANTPYGHRCIQYSYQPGFCLRAERSFHVAFLLFRSSAVFSCHRIFLILKKYNIKRTVCLSIRCICFGLGDVTMCINLGTT